MALNVLVVDGSAVMRSMLVRTLRLSALPLTNVYQAGDGAEALHALAEHDVDLVIIDGGLPVVNGETLVDAIRADRRLAGVAIVMASGTSSPAPLSSRSSAGVSVIQKPFTPEQIRATVLRVLGVAET